ncbi:hypothetical protein BC833DRAFT_570635 [Globomyces pollinis-pini]|nr:hypothetical protein BC833DRAFT_570635 [Globomyces pollinis-pini]
MPEKKSKIVCVLEVISDHGELDSNLSKEFFQKYQVSVRFSTPDHPQSNAIVESESAQLYLCVKLDNWYYHCDIEHSAFCGLSHYSPPKTTGFYNGIEYSVIQQLVISETAQNTLKIPEYWISTNHVRYADTRTPLERDWCSDAYTIISKNNSSSLVKWHKHDCRQGPNKRIPRCT